MHAFGASRVIRAPRSEEIDPADVQMHPDPGPSTYMPLEARRSDASAATSCPTARPSLPPHPCGGVADCRDPTAHLRNARAFSLRGRATRQSRRSTLESRCHREHRVLDGLDGGVERGEQLGVRCRRRDDVDVQGRPAW